MKRCFTERWIDLFQVRECMPIINERKKYFLGFVRECRAVVFMTKQTSYIGQFVDCDLPVYILIEILQQ